jgi:1-acyl-sn-glycerol-3-phosphate acyltransferase
MIIIQFIRSIVFIAIMYVWMLILGIVGIIPAALYKDGAHTIIKMYSRNILWLLRVVCGVRYEIRGEIPTGSVIIASKHQSFMDVIMHTATVERVNFIMKQELRWAPILGFYAARIGAAPIKRGDKGKAVKQMIQGASKMGGAPTQLVIYPQGTRVPPGVDHPYKVGAAILCERMGKPCIPAATNAGVHWPKHSLMRKPGLVIVEYLPELPMQKDPQKFISQLKELVETASDRLAIEGLKK